MSDGAYANISDDVLAGLRPPRPLYYVILLLLAGGIGCAATAWVYQVKTGMGVAGISHPVAWGVYIANFVFWVGIAHSGTLISAILHLVRSRWRTAVSRSAEAMTIFAVLTAGLFPLIHLGRIWVVYYIIPYPSQRQLWPNFTSPLVWDVVAITTYLTVSIIFFYVGLIPDAASARDRSTRQLGPADQRSRFYRILAAGWVGSGDQWRHHSRAYLFFAALATPLVVSVHSVVSWDFAVSNLPGWHTTIFAPYFVAGAIHSGLAMVLTLLIPMRKLLHLERVITIEHFSSIAKTMIVTTLIVAFAYVVEPFISWYSGNVFEQQFAWWRASGWIKYSFWSLTLLNVLIPLSFLFARCRRTIWWLMVVAISVNVGMWLERYVIVVASTAHDFLPHNWGPYRPTWVEVTITAGSFMFFFFWFFGFSKFLPTVAASDVKELHFSDASGEHEDPIKGNAISQRPPQIGVLTIYEDVPSMLSALRQTVSAGFRAVETYSPFRVTEAEHILKRGPSPVRLWTLGGALLGLTGGFALAMGSAMVNNLIVGGKFTPRTVIPYCIIAFEGTVLLGSIFNLLGVFYHCRLGKKPIPRYYDERFSRDHFGLFVGCPKEDLPAALDALKAASPKETRVFD